MTKVQIKRKSIIKVTKLTQGLSSGQFSPSFSILASFQSLFFLCCLFFRRGISGKFQIRYHFCELRNQLWGQIGGFDSRSELLHSGSYGHATWDPCFVYQADLTTSPRYCLADVVRGYEILGYFSASNCTFFVDKTQVSFESTTKIKTSDGSCVCMNASDAHQSRDPFSLVQKRSCGSTDTSCLGTK